MVTNRKDVNALIESFMEKLSIKDYQIDFKGNSEKGDGYAGEITFLKVKTREVNGRNVDFDLVIKSAKQSIEFRKQTPVKEAYDREIYMYDSIFVEFKKFQINNGIENPFDKFPKCYLTLSKNFKEALVFDNLKSKNFELHDRKIPMNLNHILMVIQNYANYHALSLALKQQKPELFKSMIKSLSNVMGQFIIKCNMLKGFTQSFLEGVKFLQLSHPDYYKMYNDMTKDIETFLVHCKGENEATAVILHGDCWNNNFMFKYNNDNKIVPKDMAFLDFQTSQLASPICDLSYFLYACADENSLKFFDTILLYYHYNLVKYTKELGTDITKLITFEKLKNDWKMYGKYGIFMSSLVLKVALCNPDEAPDLEKIAETSGDYSTAFNMKIENDDVYGKRFKGILIHFAEMFC